MPALLSEIKFYNPKSLNEALAIRASERNGVRVVAGGTDVMVWQGAGSMPLPQAYLSIWGLAGLRGIKRVSGHLQIGALTTYTDLLRHPDVESHFPALIDASRQVGAVQIQNRGTLGGNVVNASPAGDTLPVLAALDALLVVESQARGPRIIPFNEFYTGYRKTALADDELLTRIELPIPPDSARQLFGKVGSRRAQTISKVMASIQADFTSDGRMSQVALAYGSVAPVIVRMPKTEAALRGQRASVALVDQVASILESEISPIDDVRSTADYRRYTAVGLLRRFMRAWEGR